MLAAGLAGEVARSWRRICRISADLRAACAEGAIAVAEHHGLQVVDRRSRGGAPGDKIVLPSPLISTAYSDGVGRDAEAGDLGAEGLSIAGKTPVAVAKSRLPGRK